VIIYEQVGLWLWKSLENYGIFFLLFCGHHDISVQRTTKQSLLPHCTVGNGHSFIGGIERRDLRLERQSKFALRIPAKPLQRAE